jgi:hypothetical protein
MTTAFAVTHNGQVLVDTVRSSEGEAKSAAIKLAHQPGVSWKDLQARGFALVSVVVTPARWEPQPRPRPAAGILDQARERLAARGDAPADLQPVRLLLGSKP